MKRQSVFSAVRRHGPLVAAAALGWPVLYNLLLIGGAMARFGALPNYAVHADLTEDIRLILLGTASMRDIGHLLSIESLLEVGHKQPPFGAIWSVSLPLGKLLLQFLTGSLFGAFLSLSRSKPQCRSRPAATAAGAGLGLLAIGGATIGWVVCCGAPSWITVLTMFGVGTFTALGLEPYGPWLVAGGLALMMGAVGWQNWRALRT